ncbi:MAG: hypothetical protein IJI14_08335 [Anaerolineaceae bacterium]|nr:hypothetical protein [Anaerolineaceae bacterium]
MGRKSKYLAGRSKKIVDFVNEFRETHEYGPSLQEIGEHIGVASTSLLIYYINRLTAEGYIIRDPKVSRSIRVLKPFE